MTTPWPNPANTQPNPDPAFSQPPGAPSGSPTPESQGIAHPQPAHPGPHPNSGQALVFGILGFFIPVLWPFAWRYAAKARSEMRQQPQRWQPSAMLTTGWVLGIAGTILLALVLVGSFLMMMVS